LKVRNNFRNLTIVITLLAVGGILLSLYVSSSLGQSRQSPASASAAIVPILWESTNFNMSNGETPVQAAAQFKANFIFRGSFQWGFQGVHAGPESSTPLFLKTSHGIASLKESNPHLLFEGGFGTQFLPRNVTWVNGTAISDAAFNDMVGKNSSGGWLQLYGYEGYVPDLASPTFRTFVAQWSERQIDEGVDGMFFDDPYLYADYLVNVEHQDPTTVYDQYAGYMSSVVQSLKSYGSGQGRAFFATINSGWCDHVQGQLQYPSLIKFVSYVSCSADMRDFNATANPSLSPVENFTQLKASITAAVDVPIMVFVDWPGQQSALLKLTTQQQIRVLTNLHNQLEESGMIFVYEVFHHLPTYDSVAEGTYSALLQLARGGSHTSTLLIALALPAMSAPSGIPSCLPRRISWRP
jgi:hypothetical protein